MTNWDSILESRDITLPTKVCLFKGLVFLVVMYGCECWTIKKAECWGIDAFELWCWRKLLRVPWTERKSIQSILKEVIPEYSLERLMLKLKLQYFCHLLWRTASLEKTLMLGKIEGRRRRGWQDEMVGWHHWLDRHESEQIQELLMNREAWRAAVHTVSKSWTWLSYWMNWCVCVYIYIAMFNCTFLWNCLTQALWIIIALDESKWIKMLKWKYF